MLKVKLRLSYIWPINLNCKIFHQLNIGLCVEIFFRTLTEAAKCSISLKMTRSFVQYFLDYIAKSNQIQNKTSLAKFCNSVLSGDGQQYSICK